MYEFKSKNMVYEAVSFRRIANNRNYYALLNFNSSLIIQPPTVRLYVHFIFILVSIATRQLLHSVSEIHTILAHATCTDKGRSYSSNCLD